MIEPNEKNLYEAVIGKYGKLNQIDQAIEEMAELTVALNKYKRCFHFGEGEPFKILSNICEEMVDVQIMLDQLTIIFGDDNLLKDCKAAKIARLERKLGMNTEEDAK